MKAGGEVTFNDGGKKADADVGAATPLYEAGRRYMEGRIANDLVRTEILPGLLADNEEICVREPKNEFVHGIRDALREVVKSIPSVNLALGDPVSPEKLARAGEFLRRK